MGKTIIKHIQAIDAGDIPDELVDKCLDIDDEFPLHYSNGIVRMYDDGNPVSEWLKSVGFIFEDKNGTPLAVWGT